MPGEEESMLRGLCFNNASSRRFNVKRVVPAVKIQCYEGCVSTMSAVEDSMLRGLCFNNASSRRFNVKRVLFHI